MILQLKEVNGMEEGERTALLAIAMNLVIFGIKYVSASATGSIALKAEAFHTLADFVASLTVFTGLKIAKRKTKSFPYGLYKIENLMSVIISLVILYTGYEIILDVINTDLTELRNSGFAIFSLLIATFLTFWFSNYERKIGHKINSPILLADSSHIRIDVLSNLIVLLVVVASLFGFHFDKIAALIVVIFIVKTGIQILMDGIRVLLDASVDYETLSKVEKIILDTPQIIKLKTLTGRNSGRYKFIEADIVLKTHNLDRAHFIAERVERITKEEIKNIDQVQIHYEPLQKEEIIYVLPLTEDKTSISPHFGEAPCFMLVTFKSGTETASKTEILTNPYANIQKGKGILAAELIVKNMVDFVLVKNGFESKGPHYVFSDANIELV
ncbi:putative cation efflux system protein [Sporotomaculum syntrophicum]|uniref:Cation efflux system protein n=2 Tax=Sporotomaculum syntrophicum TaxID=182264 RepID=A0A9D2WML4_9FIRM|nr:putative cation efflux system protein [Sporotomaculum syntrophicum]